MDLCSTPQKLIHYSFLLRSFLLVQLVLPFVDFLVGWGYSSSVSFRTRAGVMVISLLL